MKYELVLTPAGRLAVKEGPAPAAEQPDPWMERAARSFATSPAAGLFFLAAVKPDSPPPPSFAFFRDFAGRYMTELCRTPESAGENLEGIDPLAPAATAEMVLGAPPMTGAEYINHDVLAALWIDLDAWVRSEVAAAGQGLAPWLKARAPQWHQVGRVCFHLAENKRDPEFPFAFMATYAPRLSAGGRVQYQPLGKALQEYSGERNKKALIQLLSPVHFASEKSALVKEMVDSSEVFQPLAWTPAEAYRFLQEVTVLEESGLLVRIPDWWQRRARPRVSVTIGDKKRNRLSADMMLDFRVEIALGEEKLTKEEWRRILEMKEGLVFLRGQWVEIDRERLSEALEHWKRVEEESEGQGISFLDGMRLLAGAPADLRADEVKASGAREWAYVGAGAWLSQVLSGLRDPAKLDAGPRGKDFRGVLRPYQKAGHAWLWFLANLGLGACLADDMGLGKTIQVLSVLLAFKAEKKAPAKPSLLVLPASLLSNWKAEIQRFAPTLKACFVHPSEIPQAEIARMAKDPEQAFSGADVVLTTYGMLVRNDWLLALPWRLAILDEAQAIKNPSARQTRAVKQIRAEARMALTGTPVENRLSELWSLFDFLSPGLLGSAARFKEFIKALEQREHDRYAPLRNLVRPYILRRLKSDKTVIADLPDKTEMKAYCGLSRKQAALYARSVTDLGRAIDGADGIRRRGLVLAFLLRFKQICNHPSHLTGDGVYDPADSGKFDRLRSLCEEIASRQEKALVFSQFREMTEPLAAFLNGVFGREGLVLHGAIPVNKRRRLIETFATDDGPPFFVLSLKAGGTGLNLTAASHVIHFDRWWNPAVENQATDRAYRIGQHRNVLVHKFICRGTVEEKIDALIDEKSRLADDLLSAGAESMLTEMTDQELLDIVSLDIDRATL